MKSTALTCFSVALLFTCPVAGEQHGIARISVDSSGGEATEESLRPAISGNGRYIAFQSADGNLVPSDNNNEIDIFVHDRFSGKVSRVSVSSHGVEGNGRSIRPAISANGRFVAFESSADNLVTGDQGQRSDIFLHDRVTSITTRVSVNSLGVEGDRDSSYPVISADGRHVAFNSIALNLVANDTNSVGDVFVHDTTTGTTKRVSVSSSGIEGDRLSGFDFPSISKHGRFIAFTSYAENLVAGLPAIYKNVFVHDQLTAQTTAVSVDSFGAGSRGFSYAPSISEDGRFVAFFSSSSELVVGDSGVGSDIFLHDRATAQTTRVSVSSSGAEANASSHDPFISANGRYIVFDSLATNLVFGDTNNQADLFLHDTTTGITERISKNALGEETNGMSDFATLSANGQLVAFASASTNLVPNDSNAVTDIFVHDRRGPALTKQGLCPGGVTLLVSGGTPGQAVAMLFGAAGSHVQTTGPCQGVELAIGQPQLGGIAITNSLGVAPFPFVAPAGACGLRVQAVNLATCTPTNVMEL